MAVFFCLDPSLTRLLSGSRSRLPRHHAAAGREQGAASYGHQQPQARHEQPQPGARACKSPVSFERIDTFTLFPFAAPSTPRLLPHKHANTHTHTHLPARARKQTTILFRVRVRGRTLLGLRCARWERLRAERWRGTWPTRWRNSCAPQTRGLRRRWVAQCFTEGRGACCDWLRCCHSLLHRC